MIHPVNNWLRLLPLLALALAAAAAEPEAEEALRFQAEATRIELSRVSAAGVGLQLYLKITPHADARLHNISFLDMRANGATFYLAPYREPIRLKTGESTELGPFDVELRFIDLHSLEPARRATEESGVRIEGTVRLEVELNWMGRLALWSKNIAAQAPLDAWVPVETPQDPLTQGATTLALALADPLVRAAAHLRRDSESWFSEVEQVAGPRVELLRTRFELLSKGNEAVAFESVGFGVYDSARTLLVPRELLYPWAYDPGAALALKRGELRLGDRVRVDITGGPALLDLAGGEAEVRANRCERVKQLALDSRGKAKPVRVCRVGAMESVERIAVSGGRTDIQPMPVAFLDDKAEVEVALLRALPAIDTHGRRFEIVRLRGRRVGPGFELLQPLDRSALGSPVLLEGAAVGLFLGGTEVLSVEAWPDE